MFRLVKYFLIERFIYVCIYSVFYVYINCIDFKSGYLIKCIIKKKYWFICIYRVFNVNFNCIDFKSGIFFLNCIKRVVIYWLLNEYIFFFRLIKVNWYLIFLLNF